MSRRKRRNNSFLEPRLELPRIKISDKIKRDILGIFIFSLSVIIILSFYGLSGSLGDGINKISKLLFGYGYVLFPFTLIVWGWKIIRSEEDENLIKSEASIFGVSLMLVSIVSFFHVFYNPSEMFDIAKSGDGTGGGYIGAVFAWVFVSFVGSSGAIVVITMFFLVSVLIAFNVSLSDILKKLTMKKADEKVRAQAEEAEADAKEIRNIKINISGQEKKRIGILASIAEKLKSRKKEKPEKKEYHEDPDFSIKPIEDPTDAKEVPQGKGEIAENEETDPVKSEEAIKEADAKPKKLKRIGSWKLPSVNILDGMDSEPTSGDIKANSNIIKRTLANFGIMVDMGDVNVGPTVTQYTLKPAVGIKLSRITALQNDLALALAARSLRIEAPIPGRSLVGIEIPNQAVAMVRLKNILNSKEFYNRKSNLSIILGRDVAGTPIIANLAKMPHLMIAGATGSGKTVCVNTLITGLLFQNSPETIKFIMVDPKRVELTSYNDIPHLLSPVITDPDKAINALKWSISEMDNRYELLSHIGCRNIESYNNMVSAKYAQLDILPYIVIVIDELADLMATHGREMEAAVVRLAQMARAVGIHLVLSTQRPSVEVITGLIKANITTRIAFQVASQIDSRTILDMSGAEKLLGSGDMLYLSNESNKPRRIQGVFISEEEVNKVSEYLKSQKEGEVEYNEEVTSNKKSQLGFGADGEEGESEDNRFDEAVEVVRSAGKASASLLQRRMSVGYARAARLLDLMEDKGIIGPGEGAKPREVYVEDTLSEPGISTDESGGLSEEKNS